MLDSIRRWLEPPSFPGDEDKNRRAKLVNSLCNYFLLLLLLYAVIYVPFFASNKLFVLALIGVLALLYFFARRLIFRGRVDQALGLAITSTWAIFQALAFVSGGLNSPLTIVAYATMVILGLRGPTPYVLALLALSILAELSLALLQSSQFPLPDLLNAPPLARWFVYTLSLGFVFSTISLVTRNLERALRREREQSEAVLVSEARLRESEERFRSIVVGSPDAVLLSDPATGLIVDANPQAAALLGRSPADLLDQPHSALYALPETGPAAQSAGGSDDWLANESPSERLLSRLDGTLVRVEVLARMVTMNGRPMLLSVLRDSTARHAAQVELQRKSSQIEALRQIGIEMTAELDQVAVLDSIARHALNLCGGVGSSLYLYDPAADVIKRVFNSGPSAIPSNSIRRRGEGLLGKVWSSNAPVLVNDYRGWQERSRQYDDFPTRAVLGVPIHYGSEFLGVLSVRADPPMTYSSADVDALTMFADQAAIAIRNARLYAEVQSLAVHDELTGIYNRRGLQQLGEREVERARRFQRPLCIILLDIDHFKRVNDDFGHARGDRVLRLLADTCRTVARSVDVLARYGGEEFVVLLPETDLMQATAIAERLRLACEQMQVPPGPADPNAAAALHVTISAGVAQLRFDHANLAGLLTLADQALYLAKQSGRNRVHPWQ